ncbi:nitrate transporter NarK [Bacillus carboniphilus]|uniref:Nitrate transporter NarK n=1 Tax=Bacillus carboniphilus TaxID=86663 RepID=A0ABN0W4B7_9BACI
MKPKLQLSLQTSNLVLGFMIWVIISSLIPFIKEDIVMNPDQIALVTAVPVILGSLLRIPLGYWANQFGARKMFLISFVILMFPVYYISEANSYSDLIIGGILLGLGGAVFSIGVTSLPKYFPKEKHGFVNGIYGAGNIGTAVTTFSAPFVASTLGWSMTIKIYLVLLGAFILLNFLLGDRKETSVKTPLVSQIKSVYRNEKLWFLSLFYFITFGSFVAFTIFLPSFLVDHFEISKVDAGIRTAGFIGIATFLRPVGGWMGDRFNSLVVLMLVFSGITIAATILAFSPSIAMYTVGCLSIAVFAGIGNGIIFKLVPHYFQKQAGVVNGIVSAMGGLGGFFPPLMLSFLFSLTGHFAIGFMALSELALASLIIVIWMYYHDKLHLSKNIIEHTVEGIMITDKNGVILSVNPSFTKVTGFTEEEVVGKTPSLLKSGIQDQHFYQKMWQSIEKNGCWQGEIWNRRKNGETYLEWLTISAIKDEANEVKCFAGMFSDITSTQKNTVNQ